MLAQLEIQEAAAQLGIPAKPKVKAKPIQPSKKIKKESNEEVPRRQSLRLMRAASVTDNETPAQKRKRDVRVIWNS